MKINTLPALAQRVEEGLHTNRLIVANFLRESIGDQKLLSQIETDLLPMEPEVRNRWEMYKCAKEAGTGEMMLRRLLADLDE